MYNSEYLFIGRRIRHQTTFGENDGFQLHPEQHPLFQRKLKRARSCEIQATKIGGRCNIQHPFPVVQRGQYRPTPGPPPTHFPRQPTARARACVAAYKRRRGGGEGVRPPSLFFPFLPLKSSKIFWPGRTHQSVPRAGKRQSSLVFFSISYFCGVASRNSLLFRLRLGDGTLEVRPRISPNMIADISSAVESFSFFSLLCNSKSSVSSGSVFFFGSSSSVFLPPPFGQDQRPARASSGLEAIF